MYHSASNVRKLTRNHAFFLVYVINTDPVLSVPNASGVPNVPTVPNVPKLTTNDPTVPKKLLGISTKTLSVPNRCTKRTVWQSAPNVPKLTRNDA